MSEQEGAFPLSEPDRTPPSFEKQTVDEETFVGVLKEVVTAFEQAGFPYVVIGGIASAVLGRPRWTQDIDVLVRAQDAKTALDALAGAGFDTQETYPHWLFKGLKDGVIVDILFKSEGGIYLDEEMLARSRPREFGPLTLPMASPEDIIVMKALAHEEDTPRYWHDALAIIARTDLDWDYLMSRARLGARRILALLLYAQSNDLVVPEKVVRTMLETIHDIEGAGDETEA